MTSERMKAVGESTPPLSIGFDIAIAMCRRADVLGHPYPSPELRVWLANQITIAVNAARSSSPTPDGVIKEMGEDGRRPDGPGLSPSVGLASDPAGSAASIPGAGDLASQVAAQCKVVAHLARALACIHDDYAAMASAGAFASIMKDVGQRSAEFMEMLGEALNNMDATSDEDEWTHPIFIATQEAFPTRARDQRAEREDASPIREAEAPASSSDTPSSQDSGVGETEGWRSMDSAPAWEEVEIKVGCMTFRAKYVIGASLTEDERVCDQWQATREGEHPPCWSEGACWSSNIDHNPSMQPEAWRPVPAPRPSQREG